MKRTWVPPPRRHALLLGAGTLLLIGAIIGILHLCGVMLCPLRRLTGMPCFTCGSTRAIVALLHGEMLTAFRVQPLVITVVLFLIPLAGVYLYSGLVYRRIPLFSFTPMEKTILFLVLLSLTLLNWTYLLGAL